MMDKLLLRMRAVEPLGTFWGGLGFAGVGGDCGHPYYIAASTPKETTRKI